MKGFNLIHFFRLRIQLIVRDPKVRLLLNVEESVVMEGYGAVAHI